MAPRKSREREEAGGDAGDHAMAKVQYVVTNGQARALRHEAFRRAMETNERPDASAVLREILDAWMAKKR